MDYHEYMSTDAPRPADRPRMRHERERGAGGSDAGRLDALRPLVLLAFALFILLSSITLFIENVYAAGLVRVDFPPESAWALLLFSPIVLIAFPRILDDARFRLWSGVAGAALWAVSLPLGARFGIGPSGIACALLRIHIPARLRSARLPGRDLASALGAAVLISAVMRAFRSGNLFQGDPQFIVPGVMVAALAIALMLVERKDGAAARPAQEPSAGDASGSSRPEPAARPGGIGRAFGLGLGLWSAVACGYFILSSPAALARWGAAFYPAVLVVELACILLSTAFARSGRPPRPGLLIACNIAFAAALFLCLRLSRPTYPAWSVLPLDAPEGRAAAFFFWAAIVLHPVVYVDFSLVAGEFRSPSMDPGSLGAGLAASSIALPAGVLAQILTTAYDYAPAMGYAFRDRFPEATAAPALLLGIAAVHAGIGAERGTRPTRRHPLWTASLAALAGAAALYAPLAALRPLPEAPSPTLRVMAYNVQQGRSKDGERAHAEQLREMARMRPDVIALSEIDGARIANGNSDIVRYFADRLRMRTFYGPSPSSGTFGVALLSRYPIMDARVFYLPSPGEQTAAIEALISAGGARYRVVVAHLGNNGDWAQQSAILERIRERTRPGERAVLMGDFNFNAYSEQYRATTAELDDAWSIAEGRVTEPGAPAAPSKVDHVFVSRGTRVLASACLGEGPSDHPAVFAEIGPSPASP